MDGSTLATTHRRGVGRFHFCRYRSRRRHHRLARLSTAIYERSGYRPVVYHIDNTLYRDDLYTGLEHLSLGGSNLPLTVDRQKIVLVDDVLVSLVGPFVQPFKRSWITEDLNGSNCWCSWIEDVNCLFNQTLLESDRVSKNSQSAGEFE